MYSPWNILDSQALPEAPTPASSYALMDAEMKTILYNETLTDVDKWILYKLVLQRYLRKLNNHRLAKLRFGRSQAEDHSDDVVGKELSAGNKSYKIPPSVEQLKDFTTGPSVVKAHLLYTLLEKSESLEWDSLGNVSIMGFPTGALIKDYITTSMKRTMSKKPPGWELFVNCLKAQKIPNSYVINLELQNVLKTQETSTLDAMPSSPSGVIVAKHAHPNRVSRWKPY